MIGWGTDVRARASWSCLSIFFALNLLGVHQATVQAATLTGKIPGDFSVSPSGAATYSIPIALPPGLGGMQPHLSLAYSSQAGNGIVGRGWGLSGLSTITRCPSTTVSDGLVMPVRLTSDDRFCLDGQRLINVSGAYGAAGSEYRTEVDSFSKIFAIGSAGGKSANGPESFLVITKSGLTMKYGATADSRYEAQGKTVVSDWALSRAVDVRGNYYSVTYFKDSASGQHYPRQIDYSANQGGTGDSPVAPEIAAKWRVVFKYFDDASGVPAVRSDPIVGYVAGARRAILARLSEVAVVDVASGSAVSKYVLSYVSGAPANAPYASRVVSVQQCAGSDCREQTSFESVNAHSAVGFIAQGLGQEYWSGHGGGVGNNLTGDFNGDGRSDLMGFTGGNHSWHLCLSIGNGFDCKYVLANDAETSRNLTGDFNGDGKTDLMAYTGSNSQWHLCLAAVDANNLPVFNCSYPYATGTAASNHKTGDFNGDGLTDIMAYTGSNGVWNMCLSAVNAGNVSFSCNWPIATGRAASKNLAADFDGDGRTDLMAYTGSGLGWVRCLSRGTSFECGSVQATGSEAENHLVGDFNGDGLADIMAYTGHDYEWHFCLSTGSGFDCSYVNANGTSGKNNSTGDFNGDGLTDIIAYTGTGGSWHMCLSNGSVSGTGSVKTAFTCSYVIAHSGERGNNIAADFNGDGLTDLTGYGNADDNRQWHVTLGVSPEQRLTRINMGSSRFVAFVYKSIPEVLGQSYFKTDPAVGNVVPVVPVIPVLTHVEHGNGAGGISEVDYSYGTAMQERAGRGFLGFRWMKKKEKLSAIESFSEFNQLWPLTGTVNRTETWLPGKGNAGVLKKSVFGYQCYQTHARTGLTAPASATTTCGSSSAGKVYFPFMSSSTEESWDLNGTAMPAVWSSHEYGGYADQAGVVRQFGDSTKVTTEIKESGVVKHKKEVTNEYFAAKADLQNWQLGRLKKATVKSTQY